MLTSLRLDVYKRQPYIKDGNWWIGEGDAAKNLGVQAAADIYTPDASGIWSVSYTHLVPVVLEKVCCYLLLKLILKEEKNFSKDWRWRDVYKRQHLYL